MGRQRVPHRAGVDQEVATQVEALQEWRDLLSAKSQHDAQHYRRNWAELHVICIRLVNRQRRVL